MVGSAGIVASTLNHRHQRRESRASEEAAAIAARAGSKATISEIRPYRDGPNIGPHRHSASKPVPPAPPNGVAAPTTPGTEMEVIPEKLSLREQVKFYVSLSLGVTASLCVFALLFLIPLVVEPSISTLLADFDPEPATCVTVDSNYATGLSKCGIYSSCKEGCTSTPTQCHQIYVSYQKMGRGRRKLQNFTMLEARQWLDESKWDVVYTQLKVNAKGCGYPPKVNCEEYGEIYGQVGRTFPCYYSRANPRLVVTDYNWQKTAYPLLVSLGLPTILFAISISVLSFWYCPSCEERGKNKRPCRSKYLTPKTHDDSRNQADDCLMRNILPMPPPAPILQQPRGKLNPPRSPSLATISSKDTTISSVTSNEDGWQSPPSPPPRVSTSRMNASKSNLATRARKL